jgi:hypothetical protein
MSVVFDSLFTSRRPYDSAAMAARCGDDVVRLRPSWAAVIAATRFARHACWLFGNRAATLTCVEPQAKRWLTQRASEDPVQVHFDLRQWGSAYARCEGRAREIDVFATDGSVIAAVRLDDAEASLDELLWLLADDDQRSQIAAVPAPASHPCAFERAGGLAPGALHRALIAACDARLPLHLVLENAGGRVAWSPHQPVVCEAGRAIELRSALGSIALADAYAADWNVRLRNTAGSAPHLEAYGSANALWLSVSLTGPNALQQLAWRGICATLGSRLSGSLLDEG